MPFVAKRCLDLVMAGLIFIVTLPIMLVVAIAIKLESPGPVLFCQRRVGRGCQEFTCYKFRSMFVGSDPGVHREYIRTLFADEQGARTKEDVYKMTADPRVTRVGRWIRRLSIDELPQIFNVFKGEMSIVGPRPAIGYELEHHDENMLRRFSVNPGITGLWQISGRSGLTYRQMVEMDLKYIREWSLMLDIKIILKTFGYVLNISRAY